MVESASSNNAAKRWVFVAVTVDIGLIGWFKYAGFFCSFLGKVPEFIANIALPIGISFYTFQLLTYVVDVYRGDAKAQQSYWNVLLYASLFHQCIAGPIVRYQSIAEELFVHREAGPDMPSGIRRFTLGLAKKSLLANPCGALADSLMLTQTVASDVSLLTGNLQTVGNLTVLGSWLGIAAYTLQLYLDFSAYSDMAIGMGRMLGLHYLENFNYPFISRSVSEYWRRWHISLGSFFRDYVYIPLGGNRCSTPRVIFNLLIVWALTGLWHGASWNFVIWGLYYFVFLTIERLFLGRCLKKLIILPNIYAVLVSLFGWIIFRYTDLRLVWCFIKNMFALNGNRLSDFLSRTLFENNIFLLAVAIVCSTPLIKNLYQAISIHVQGNAVLSKFWDIIRTCVIPVGLMLASTCALVGNSYNPFIYFQF